MTERLKFEEVLNTFIDHLLNMFPADYLYIFDDMNDDRLQAVRCYENGKFITRKFSPIKKAWVSSDKYGRPDSSHFIGINNSGKTSIPREFPMRWRVCLLSQS